MICPYFTTGWPGSMPRVATLWPGRTWPAATIRSRGNRGARRDRLTGHDDVVIGVQANGRGALEVVVSMAFLSAKLTFRRSFSVGGRMDRHQATERCMPSGSCCVRQCSVPWPHTRSPA